MINENCWSPNEGHVAYIKKPPTSFNTVNCMLYKCNYAEQKNLNTAPVEETGQPFFLCKTTY